MKLVAICRFDFRYELVVVYGDFVPDFIHDLMVVYFSFIYDQIGNAKLLKKVP